MAAANAANAVNEGNAVNEDNAGRANGKAGCASPSLTQSPLINGSGIIILNYLALS